MYIRRLGALIVRVCLIGIRGSRLDEGVQNVGYHLADCLSRRNQVLSLDVRNCWRPTFWRTVSRFRPHVLQVCLGSSLPSFVLLWLLRRLSRGARSVILVLQPSRFLGFWGRILAWLKPDLVLAQSSDVQERFIRLGCRTTFFPNGVDTNRFKPVSVEEKHALRMKYDLPGDVFVVLHVGPIKRGRNLHVFTELQEHGCQSLILGSTTVDMEPGIYRELRQAGCIVWRRYFTHVQELYALADCYLFPTLKRGEAIELPLSVLEAMACNMPVISTPFGALERIFAPGDGLNFIRGPEEAVLAIENVREGGLAIRTREKVLAYSWDSVASRLEEAYDSLLGIAQAARG